MKKTSRRKFGKQLTGALAALPAISLASQNVRGQQPKPPMREDVRTSHNTPPDVVISDGSLIVESADELEDVGGFIYKTKGDPTAHPNITHIRVLVDNGDKLYEDLEAEGSSIAIGWQNNGGAVKKVLDISDGASFMIKSDKKLDQKTVANKHRKNKLTHSDGENFRIAFVAVTNPQGFTTIFNAPTKFEAAEFRVLVWRH